MPKGVIIQGSTGSGKTTLGRPVAPKLGIVTCNIDRKTILHCVIAIIIFLIIPYSICLYRINAEIFCRYL